VEEVETYELFVTITRVNPGLFEWGIGQEIESVDGNTDFEFLAGGEEDSLEEASLRVSEEIKALF
jgi:hypothetical protein